MPVLLNMFRKYQWRKHVGRVRNLKFATYLKFATCENTSVLKIPFLVGPGSYGFPRAGTRVLAPMGDNR